MLDNAKISISNDAHNQYMVVNDEIKKLCELTHMSWDLTGSDLFNAVRKVSFVEGAICGVALMGVIVAIRKYKKLKTTSSEE